MLDPDFIRNNPDKVRQGTKNKGYDSQLVDQWLELDKQWREQIQQVEEIRKQRNELVEEFKQKGEKPPQEVIDQGKQLKEQLQQKEDKLQQLEEQRQQAGYQIPNIPAQDVPIGKDDSENKVIKTVGDKPNFKFDPKDHLQLGEELDLIDVDRASKVSGPRFGYFKNQAAHLEMALMWYAFNKLIDKGFTPIIPPSIIKKDMERKMGYVEHGQWREMYQTQEDDLILASSSEHTVIPMHANETFNQDDLPKKYVNFSTCFRREAGSYGQDTRGMFRVHQFNKVEMNIYTQPETKLSDQMTKEMLQIQEEIMKELNLPYQIVAACTGDLPFPNRRMYDVEAWFPGHKQYRETHSCSNCTDYQTRRLNIKVRIGQDLKEVHALNATVVTDRVLLAIIENYQQKDGSIKIPKVLQKYVSKKAIK
jgi:seryl-tRNA synthetase